MKKYLVIIINVFLFASCWSYPEPDEFRIFWTLENTSDTDIHYTCYLIGDFQEDSNSNYYWDRLDSRIVKSDVLKSAWKGDDLLQYRARFDKRVISFDDVKLFFDSFRIDINGRQLVWGELNKDDSLIFGLDFYDESSWHVKKNDTENGYYDCQWTFTINQAFVDSVMKYIEPMEYGEL